MDLVLFLSYIVDDLFFLLLLASFA